MSHAGRQKKGERGSSRARGPGGAEQDAPCTTQGTISRNCTSYPVKMSAKLRELYAQYKALQAAGPPAASPEGAAAWARPTGPPPELSPPRLASVLKYYQFLVQTVLSNPEYGVGAQGNGRGLLVYHEMGMGKTRLAVSIAMASWGQRQPLILAPKSVLAGFRATVAEVVSLLEPGLEGAELEAAQAGALRRIRFITSNAGNVAIQLARATAGPAEFAGAAAAPAGPLAGRTPTAKRAAAPPAVSLEGRIVIVDEAHNFFRAIINSADENSNARQLYEMMYNAVDTRFVFLTGTPSSKNPFEIVPCFNILAGYELLPAQYEIFYKQYVDSEKMRLKNRGYLANRILGFVSHVSQSLPSEPEASIADEIVAVPTAADASSSDDGDSEEGVDSEGPTAPAFRGPRSDGGFPEVLKPIERRIEMSPEQYRAYLLVRDKEEAEGRGGSMGGPGARMEIRRAPPLALPGSERSGGHTFHQRSRQLGNFSPSKEWRDTAVADMPGEAFTAESSPKLVQLVKDVEDAPGIVLAYSQFTHEGGLGPAARFLEEAGFSEFRGGDAFPAKPGKRYAVFTGDVSDVHREAVRRAVSDFRNRRGEFIKVLLISLAGATGVDTRNFRYAVLIEPYWDSSLEDQLFSRIRRLGGHDDLPPEDRDVTLIRYIAVANREIYEGLPPGAKVETVTIDERFRARAIAMNGLNLDVRSLLREVCLECNLNGYGNCRLCVPTDAPLFHPDDSARDLRLPDPCTELVETEISTRRLSLPGGEEVHYEADPSAPLGYTFFRYDETLEAHVPVDPSEPAYFEMAEAASRADNVRAQ